MLAATWMDPVIGVDTHIVLVPAPPAPLPVPTPMPHPFVGMVFSALELVVNLLPDAAELVAGVADAVTGADKAEGHGAVGAGIVAAAQTAQSAIEAAKWITSPVDTAVDWVSGQVRGSAEANAGKVKVNGMWAAAGGGSAMATPPHMPMPFPFAVPPDNNAELLFGATGIFFEGHYPVRLLDVAMGCGDPTRMPSCIVMAIPKGYPVVVLRPQSPDLLSLVSNFLSSIAARVARRIGRIRWVRVLRVRAKRLVGRIARPGHVRSTLRDIICVLTGEPIDVATGRVLSTVVEFELPGPIPLSFERRYDSSLSWRDGVLGFGWSHSLDQAIWEEPGRVVLREADGREVDFDTLGMPGHRLPIDGSVWSALDRTRIVRRAGNRWEVHSPDDRVREFAPTTSGLAKLTRIRSRNGFHAIDLTYDSAGRLEWVRDSAGRLVRFEHDGAGRLTALKLPVAHGRGWYVHTQFHFDRRGDLVRTTDAAGSARRYDYANHLKVRKADRAGPAFYYEYDGADASARCVRSWGEGGILHRVLHYLPAKRTTIVEDSYGRPTTYVTGETGIVHLVTDALGATVRAVHDPATGRLLEETDALGRVSRCEWDARGNCTATTAADGATTRMEWDDDDRIRRIVNPIGAEWTFHWNLAHGLVRCRDPLGAETRYEWNRGVLAAATAPGGARTLIERDERHQPVRVVLANGGEIRRTYDGLGRLLKTRRPNGAVEETRYDILGRGIWKRTGSGRVMSCAYDAEDNLIEVRDAARTRRMRYSGYHELAELVDGDTVRRFEHDLDQNPTATHNAAGESHVYTLDAVGRMIAETGYDGRTRRYDRNAAGEVTAAHLPSGRRTVYHYDANGRLTESSCSDGAFVKLEYRADGCLMRAQNQTALVTYERDVVGRVLSERVGDDAVESTYDLRGLRVRLETSRGGRASLQHDVLGSVRALAIGGDLDPIMTLEHDLDGAEVRRSFWNGISIGWQRDLGGRPLRRTTSRQHGQRAVALEDVAYSWREADQLAGIADLTNQGSRAFDYDGRGRLVHEQHGETAVLRARDVADNVYRTADGHDRRYGGGGRIESADGAAFEHDEDGNRVRRVDPDGGTWAYAWNGLGLLDAVERPDGKTVRFEYDALARRTRKTLERLDPDGQRISEAETRFVWDGNQVVHELGSEVGQTDWYWLPDTFEPVARQTGRERLAIASDHMGVPTSMYDDVGQLAWRMQLDVFGAATTETTEGVDCAWRFPGQYEDGETGLYYNRNRFYDPATGQYISQDPLGPAGGFAAYAYVDDPVTYADPLGLHTYRPCKAGRPASVDSQGRSRDRRGRFTQSEAVYWPSNHGFASMRSETLPQRTIIDRYGGRTNPTTGLFEDTGRFASPAGTPFPDRALEPGMASAPYHQYEVCQPIAVDAGPAAPWFGEPGGGTQYRLPPGGIDALIKSGALRRIT